MSLFGRTPEADLGPAFVSLQDELKALRQEVADVLSHAAAKSGHEPELLSGIADLRREESDEPLSGSPKITLNR